VKAILLFDLDGTVLTFDGAPPGPGRTAIERAFERRFGVKDVSKGVRFAGGTEQSLMRALLGAAGVAAHSIDAHIAPMIGEYVRALEEVLVDRSYRAAGDVRGAVDACRARGWCVGLGTGNVREGAALKLRSAGLEGVFDLALGGFGGDAEDRADLLRTGVARCVRAIGRHDAPVVVIGDTRDDARAGRAIGAHVVGVALTDASRAELVDAGVTPIVDDCGAELVDAIARVLA
jgi:phosphoglycolate phosphatase-like HAD superfamily hydrolase